MVSTVEAIAIAEFCVYILVLLLNLVIIFRHGLRGKSGWVFLALFCLLRISGAVFKIRSVHNPDSTSDAEWAGILQSIGLSPLLMSSFGLLKRVISEISSNKHRDGTSSTYIAMSGGPETDTWKRPKARRSFRSTLIFLAHVPTMAALGLCIIGGIDSVSQDSGEATKGHKFTKIGVIVFLFVYLLLCSLVIITMKDFSHADRGEKRLYFAILSAIPFLAVRVLWSLLSAFSHNPTFSITSDKPWANLAMSVVEEFIVVCIYTMVGLTISN